MRVGMIKGMNRNGSNRISARASFPPVPRRPIERTCVGCRQAHPKGQLIRLVRHPTGQLLLDRQGKLPGRGAYLCPQRSCAEQALKGAHLREALRHDVSPWPIDELMRAIASMLEERALAYIRLARKAGRFVSGYTQVKRALASEPLACILVAEDAAVERRHEYQSLSENRQIPYRSFLTKARLGELAGRDESSAIGILDSGLSEHLMFYLEGMSRLAER